jgi:stalled ribosome alternative rescue factor ArfA
MEEYPASVEIFRDKIEKAERAKGFLERVVETYF